MYMQNKLCVGPKCTLKSFTDDGIEVHDKHTLTHRMEILSLWKRKKSILHFQWTNMQKSINST